MIQNYIKDLRKAKGMTADDLGKIVGVSRVTIGNIEMGRFWSSAEILEKIANALNVDVYELFRPSNRLSRSFLCPHCGKPIEICIKDPSGE